MAKHNHGRPDALQVQVALRIRVPKGVTVSPKVLPQIIDALVNHEELPPNVEVRGIFWRNPNRRGALSHWRYHEGADLSVAPTNAPVESAPRGSLRDATDSLGGALYSGVVTF